eukprot:g10699.t1
MPTATRRTTGEDLVFGGGPSPPEYDSMFSVKSSCDFWKNYQEYKRRIELSNSGQTVQRPLLTISQLLPRHVRRTLARISGLTGELSEADLTRALCVHGECTADSEVDPPKAAAEVKKLLTMGSESTALDRVDAAWSRLEMYFDNPSVERIFRDSGGVYADGPARIITSALVGGLKPPEFKAQVESTLAIQGKWKGDPEHVQDVIREAALAWRVVERADRHRKAAGRTDPGSNGGQQPPAQKGKRSSNSKVKCRVCTGFGHRSYDCPSTGKEGSTPGKQHPGSSGGDTGTPSGRAPSQQPRRHGAQQSKGTPAARGGGPAQPPVAGGKPVGSRAALPAGGGTPGEAAEPGVVPPAPVPVGGAASTGGPAGVGAKAASWRSVVPGAQSGFSSNGVEEELPAKLRLVDLSVPGAAKPTVCPAPAVLDSGAGVSTIPESIVRKLQVANPDVQIAHAMDPVPALRVADGRDLRVTQKTCPVRLALHTSWGPVVVSPQSFAVMPGADDVVIIGKPMLKRLGIDVDASAEETARAGHEARVTGVESPNVQGARRVTLSVDEIQPVDRVEVPDEAVERLAARGPEMVISPSEEETGREAALTAAVELASTAGLSGSGVGKLRAILDRRYNAFRRALRGDPPANVEPMVVKLKPGAASVKARPRTYNPAKTAWLTTCLATLVAMGLLFLNKQAVWASAVMATPKKQGYRMVGDFRLVNKAVEKSPGVMPNQEASMQRLSQATCYGSLDMLQGYWQMPLAPESQEFFTISGPGGLYTPTRVPQGVLNATAYFQATMTELLEGLNCMVWVDDVIYWGHDEDDLLDTLDQVLERLEGVGLFAAAHKCIFFDTSITWCGKVYSGGEVKHDPERLSGLANLRRPETAALASSSGEDWNVDVLDDDALKHHVRNVVEVQAELHKDVSAKVNKNREKQRKAESRDTLESLVFGNDFDQTITCVEWPPSRKVASGIGHYWASSGRRYNG